MMNGKEMNFGNRKGVIKMVEWPSSRLQMADTQARPTKNHL